MTIRVRAGFSATGLWDDQNNMIDPVEAGIPVDLVAELSAWIEFFSYECFEPGELTMIPEKAVELHARGRGLTERIKESQPTLDINYVEINEVFQE
jgi:hypothetical protein